MTRSHSPVLFLDQSTTTSRRPHVRIHFFDYVFLTLSLIVICGGCLFVMDLASAHSSGQESPMMQMLNNIGSAIPALMHGIAKYALLFLASVLNSALIVGLVYGLRALDSKVSRGPRRQYPMFMNLPRPSSQNVRGRKAAMRVRETVPFLLSPVFR
jgi:hypothetical protein